MTTLRPLNDHVIVRQDKPDKTSRGGVVLPDRDEGSEPILTGTVLAVGPGKLDERDGSRTPPDVKPGDYIKFQRWGWDEIIPNIGDEPVLVMTGEHVDFVILERGGLDSKPSK